MAREESILMASSAGTMPNTGRWGWYQDHEGREYRRVSTLIKKVATDTHALEEWKKRQVLIGAAKRNDIVLGVKALGEPGVLGWTQQQKRQLGTWAEDCMTAAGSSEGAISGTAMHDLTERVDRGQDIEEVVRGLPAPVGYSLRAYAKLRELNGWRSVEIERTVVCDELDVAGSFDRIDVVPGLAKLLGNGTCQHADAHHGHSQELPGQELPVIVDVKTESSPLLNGLHIGPQLAIYSRARRMWLPDGRYVDAPCVRQDVAIIVHVRDGKAIPYFVDLAAGWEAAQAAARQLEREKAAKKWFAPVPGIIEPKTAEVLTEGRVAAMAAGAPPALATAMLDASKVQATVLGPAPMPNAEYRIGDKVTVGGIEFTKHAEMPTVEQVAERGADGLVRWAPGLDIDKRTTAQALAEIWQATTLDQLAGVYEAWTKTLGLAWVGAVATAAERKRKEIECPQKALHTGAGKCACGWTEPPF